MASAWQIFLGLSVLAAAGFGYVVLDKPVNDQLDQRASDAADRESATTFYDRLSEMWSLGPVFVVVAVAAYMIKETVVDAPGVR